MVMWECFLCGMFNKEESTFCSRCFATKEDAVHKTSTKKKMCEECGHQHVEGVFCHVFVDSTDFGNFNEGEGEEFESVDKNDFLSDSDSDDLDIEDERAGFNSLLKLAARHGQQDSEAKELKTPQHVRRINYSRCNCRVGIPSKSSRFIPVPKKIMIGKIFIPQYDDILALEAQAELTRKNARYEEESITELLAKQEKEQEKLTMLPKIFPFLALHEISLPAKISKNWNFYANDYDDYRDVRDCTPWFVIKAHKGPVDSILVTNDIIYSSGDKKVLAHNVHTGDFISQVSCETTVVPVLTKLDICLVCGSGNGTLKTFPFQNDARRMKLVSLLPDAV